MEKRLDVAIETRGLAKSRSKAQDLIKRGLVRVNGTPATKASASITDADTISVAETAGFVSRGGEKLAAALDAWHIQVMGLTAVDVGASTGGFTDCLISRGASHVYAIDVGTNQLDEKLRSDPRITVMEQTDVRRASLPELAGVVVVDLSFISLSLVLQKVASLTKTGGDVILLVKPQFEVGREAAHKAKGVIRDAALQEKAVADVITSAVAAGLTHEDTTSSPIEGGDGNKEFLLHFKR